MNKRKILLSITGIITVLLITIGLSYAYFSANLTGGEEATTITVTGGTMNIIYNGGASINVANIIPSDNAISTKTFTVTGNNTTDIEMKYQISLIVEENTFSEEALKYKLISTNTDNNGTVVPSINELTNIGTGSKTIELGIGNFISPTVGNKVHTYSLEIYFPNANYNQNEDQEKEFRAYIQIDNYVESCPTDDCLNYLILVQGNGTAAIKRKGNPDFNKISTPEDSGLYASEDEYGTSYYYRGERNLLNNNLIFGGFQWKIIRINGDNSVRVIYNGTEEQFHLSGTMNTIGENTQIFGTHPWNLNNYNDNKYVGYMYGGANGIASVSRVNATTNETSSNAKIRLDEWYQNNLANTAFVSKIVDNIFCNNRQLQSEIGGPPTGTGYGLSETLYAGHFRIVDERIATLKCKQKNDRFTKDDKTLGNGALSYPVGLISVDESAMSGLLWSTENITNYLYTNQIYWTFSPCCMLSVNDTYVFLVRSDGELGVNYPLSYAYGLRPVINLSPSVQVTGDGSATNPYRVLD